MHGPQSSYKHSKLSLSNHQYKDYSPKSINRRPSPKLFEKLYSPKASKISANLAPDISDFINHLQDQLKRISSSFSFKFFAEPPLVQASDFVTQAVDFYLNEKEKLSESFKRKYEFTTEKEFFTQPKENNESEKAKQITKNLTRFEHLLKKKEEKLEEKKKKLKKEKIRLSE